MNIKNRITFIGLLGLLSSGILMVGCAETETLKDDDIVEAPAVQAQAAETEEAEAPMELIRGEGSGVFTEIAISSTSMFEFNRAEISDAGKRTLDEYRKNLGPELTEAYMVLIVGHTDSSGDENYNLALSQKRAQSVADYLVSTGSDADRLRVIGRGSKDPVASNDTREGRIQNRRVDILVVAEIRDLDTLVFPSVALFERKSAELTEQGKALIDENRMNARALLNDAYYIEIVGHTDNVGDEEDNMMLSQQRAESVRDYLVSRGLDASKVVTAGKGETMPVASNDSEEGRAKNRRVEVLVLGRFRENEHMGEGIELGETIVVTAEVLAIDKEDRSLTLLGPEDTVVDLLVTDDVRNFDQIKVGDQLSVEYYSSVAIYIGEVGSKPKTDTGLVAVRAEKGEKPGALAVGAIDMSASIVAIDKTERTLKLKLPDGSMVTTEVDKAVQVFDSLRVGDTIHTRLTKAVAISVEVP
jgi:outer membrane protein OmpA-like peptidoglycan-associated protein